MTYDPQRHHRQSIRLKGYDYAQSGAYYVTVVVQNRDCLFGEIADGQMRLNAFGEIVQTCWNDLPNHYPHVELDAFVVMPNHVHGVIVINDTVGASLKLAPTTDIAPTDIATMDAAPANMKRHGLPEIVRGFKTFSARRINELRGTPGVPVWQRNYYERVVRDGHALNRIRQYIVNNPKRWVIDRERG
jgi:REP element-mobilizing transposase RayT